PISRAVRPFIAPRRRRERGRRRARARDRGTTRHASAAPLRLGSTWPRGVRRRLAGTGPVDPWRVPTGVPMSSPSSDPLEVAHELPVGDRLVEGLLLELRGVQVVLDDTLAEGRARDLREIGRASCRERWEV